MIVNTVRPRGWDPAGTYTGGLDRREDPNPVRWRDCPTCWAGGRLYEEHPEGWTVESCPTCLGVGQVTA